MLEAYILSITNYHGSSSKVTVFHPEEILPHRGISGFGFNMSYAPGFYIFLLDNVMPNATIIFSFLPPFAQQTNVHFSQILNATSVLVDWRRPRGPHPTPVAAPIMLTHQADRAQLWSPPSHAMLGCANALLAAWRAYTHSQAPCTCTMLVEGWLIRLGRSWNFSPLLVSRDVWNLWEFILSF